MNINITSRHFRADEALKSYAETKISRLGKFFDGVVNCDVIFSPDHSKSNGSHKLVEIKLAVYNKILTAQETTDDYFKGIDKAVDKLEMQLKKFKEKLHHE
jgi:ribosomal subunit interface protein